MEDDFGTSADYRRKHGSGPLNVKRKQRLQVILFSMTALAVALYAIFTAFEQNMNIFYPPHEVKNGLAPVGKNIRIGGMVLNGSVKRGKSTKMESHSERLTAGPMVWWLLCLPG